MILGAPPDNVDEAARFVASWRSGPLRPRTKRFACTNQLDPPETKDFEPLLANADEGKDLPNRRWRFLRVDLK
jgi:hypothetical protein